MRMKRYLTILAAAAAIVCGCNKYDDTIADLQNRVDKTEKTVSDLVSKVDALQKLVDAATSGVSITSVTAVDGGFTVAFSDGTSFTVINGKDGQAGAAGQDAEGITVTEDSLCYNFDFGDGSDIISVAKAGAFAFKIESDVIELAAGTPASIPYVLVGADDSTKIFVESEDYDVEVGDTEISVSAAKVVPGCFILKAIRNSDGATCAFVITVEKKEVEMVTIDLTVDNILYNGATVNAKISKQDVYYFCSVMESEYFDYTDPQELVDEIYSIYYSNYGTSYSSYGFSSFDDLFFNGLCYIGDDNIEFELDPEAEYVAFAVAITDDYEACVEEIATAEFETPALEAEYLGVAIWHDSFVNDLYGLTQGSPELNLDLPVDVYELQDQKGIFIFDSPYNYANICSWFEMTPEEAEAYEGDLWQPVQITIDASDPSAVDFKYQNLGICIDPEYGWISGGANYSSRYYSYGKYENGVISFTEKMFVSEEYETSLYYANNNGDFTIIMPDTAAGAPAKTKAVKTNTGRKGFGKTLKASNRPVFYANGKSNFTICK